MALKGGEINWGAVFFAKGNPNPAVSTHMQLTPFPKGHKGLQKKLQIYSFPFRISSVGMAKVTGQTLTKTQMHNWIANTS